MAALPDTDTMNTPQTLTSVAKLRHGNTVELIKQRLSH